MSRIHFPPEKVKNVISLRVFRRPLLRLRCSSSPSSPIHDASCSPKEGDRNSAIQRRSPQGPFRFCKGQKKVSRAELSPPSLNSDPREHSSLACAFPPSLSLLTLLPRILNPSLGFPMSFLLSLLESPVLTCLSHPFPRTQASIPEYDPFFPSNPSSPRRWPEGVVAEI